MLAAASLWLTIRRSMLGVFPLKQGVGLDFVRRPEYGRLRWQKYRRDKMRSIEID